MPSDLRTRAIVLRRTNYGESDRILSFLTPEGKISALARGVRKEKSRLAGSIELFSVADVVIHQGRSNLATLTSAKMLRFYSNILADVKHLEFAAQMMKKIEIAAEQANSPEHFSLLMQGLDGLNRNLDTELIHTWFWLNYIRAGGEEINLLRDVSGCTLSPDLTYTWDYTERALSPNLRGTISAKEIKFARFLLANPLLQVSKIDDYQLFLPKISPIMKNLLQST